MLPWGTPYPVYAGCFLQAMPTRKPHKYIPETDAEDDTQYSVVPVLGAHECDLLRHRRSASSRRERQLYYHGTVRVPRRGHGAEAQTKSRELVACREMMREMQRVAVDDEAASLAVFQGSF